MIRDIDDLFSGEAWHRGKKTECHFLGIALALGAAGTLASGVLNSNATKSAANTEANAANRAADVQQNIYNQTRADLAPYLNTGTSALSSLAQLLGIGGGSGAGTGTGSGTGPNTSALETTLRNYPGYQFSFDEGLRALNQSGASRGLLNSSSTIRNATQFGQGMASSVLGDYLSRLSSISGLGENAGSITGTTGVSSGANIGNSIMNAGSAAGAGTLGSSMALTGGFNGAINNSLLAYQLMQGGGAGLTAPDSSPLINAMYNGWSSGVTY